MAFKAKIEFLSVFNTLFYYKKTIDSFVSGPQTNTKISQYNTIQHLQISIFEKINTFITFYTGIVFFLIFMHYIFLLFTFLFFIFLSFIFLHFIFCSLFFYSFFSCSLFSLHFISLHLFCCYLLYVFYLLPNVLKLKKIIITFFTHHSPSYIA